MMEYQSIKSEETRNNFIKDLKTMPYKEYLKTDHWKRMRSRKLRQSGNKCQICGETKELNVHHNTYKNLGCEKDEDLVVLCNECHKKHHGIDNVKSIENIVDNNNTYKTKLFVLNLLDSNTDCMNEFISTNTKEVLDIKTNVIHNTYTALLIYK